MSGRAKFLLIGVGVVAGLIVLVATLGKNKHVVVVILSPLLREGVAAAVVECLTQRVPMEGTLKLSIVTGDHVHTVIFREGNRLKRKPIVAGRIRHTLDSLFPETITPASAQTVAAALGAEVRALIIVNADSSAKFTMPIEAVKAPIVCWLGVVTSTVRMLADYVHRNGGTFELIDAYFVAAGSSIAPQRGDEAATIYLPPPVMHPSSLLDIYVVSPPDEKYRTILWQHLDTLAKKSRIILVHRADTVIMVDSNAVDRTLHQVVASAPPADVHDYPNLFAPLQHHCSTTEPVHVVIVGNMNQLGERRIVDLRCLRGRENLRFTIATHHGRGRLLWRSTVKALQVSAYEVP